MSNSWLFTSESVTEGHPDKVADQISDAVLDSILDVDPMGRVACETLVTRGLCVVAAEITASGRVDIERVARDTIASIGYTDPESGFDASSCAVLVSVAEQSRDIAQGVDAALEIRSGSSTEDLDAQGAGDQGMMFGFACDEGFDTELMPVPIWLAHRMAEKLSDVRKAGLLEYLRPDGKTQITVRYEGDKPVGLATVVLSTQHDPGVDVEKTLTAEVLEHVILPVIPPELTSDQTEVLVNPTGRFVIGGPQGDTGLTGRKIIVDTYGGMGRHGGGCFSGKDPTKVDRTGAYGARMVAKYVVASKVASKCEVEIAYAIGRARPISLTVDTFGTCEVSQEKLSKLIEDFFDLRPAALIAELDLRRPIFTPTAAYGHFGRVDKDFTWEQTPRLDDFIAAVSAL